MAGGVIKQTIRTDFKTSGAQKVEKDTDRIGKAQTRLGQASASSGRQFSAQAQGLGGVVGVYAAAAANVFALTAAFTALNRAAQFETIVRGTEALANAVGTSGSEVIRTLKDITNGQLSIVEAATQANLALSAGFNTKQIGELGEVALKASKALGRNLTDSFQRITRGAIKLEPELLDEIGIFTRIEPAVNAYALSIGKSASQLTQFERRQAFVNQVILDGQRAFEDIDTSVLSTQETFEKLVANFADLAIITTSIIADALAPLAAFIDKNLGNRILLLGAIGLLVFGRLKDAFTDLATRGLTNLSQKLSGLADNLAKNKKNADALASSYKNVATQFQGQGAFAGTREQISAGAQLKQQLQQGLTTQQAISAQKLIPQLLAAEETRRASIKATVASSVLEQAKLTNATAQSEERSRLLNETMKNVTAQTQSAGIAARGLAKGLIFASNAALALRAGLAAAFAKVQTLIIVLGTLQFVLSFFGIDLFSAIRDGIRKLGEETRFTKKGFEALKEEAKNTNVIFEDIRQSLLIEAQLFKEILPGAISASGRSLKQLERELKSAKNNLILEQGTNTLFGGQDQEDIEYYTNLIEELNTAIEIRKVGLVPLANLVGELAEKEDKNAQVLAKSVLSGRAAANAQGELTLTLGRQAFVLGTVEGANARLIESLEGITFSSADAGNKFQELQESLAEASTTSDKAGERIGVIQTLLIDAADAAKKLGADGEEAFNTIQKFLKEDVAQASELVATLQEIDKLNKAIAKSTNTQALDEAIPRGLVSVTGELAKNEEQTIANQAEVLKLLNSRLETLRKLDSVGKLDINRRQEIKELETTLGAIQNAAQARTLEQVKTLAERKKQEDKTLVVLLNQLEVAELQVTLSTLQLQNSISQAEESLRIQKTEESRVNELKNIQNLNKEIESSIEKQRKFETDLLQLAQKRADIESKIAKQAIELENARSATRDDAAVSGAKGALIQAEEFSTANERELAKLRLNVIESQNKAELSAIERRENLAIFERDQQIAALERQENAILLESQQSEQILESNFRKITEERNLFDAQKSLEDAKRGAERQALQNRLNELTVQETLQVEQIRLNTQQRLADQQNNIRKAKLIKTQIEADTAAVNGQFKFLNAYRDTLNRVFGANLDQIESPFVAATTDIDSIINTLETGLNIIQQTGNAQVKNAENVNSKTEEGVLAQINSLDLVQKASDAAADTQNRIFDKRVEANEKEFLNTTELLAERLKNIDLEKQSVRDAVFLKLEQAGVERETAYQAIELARQRYAYEFSQQKRLNEAYKAARDITENYVENGLMALNTALIEGELTFKNIAQGFKDMLGSMLKEIQSAVFRQTVAQPIAEFVGGLFAAGGRVHLAAGGSMKRDRVAAMLEPGEFVIRKEAAKKLGMSKLQELNAGISNDPIARIIASAYGSKVKRAAGGSINDPTIEDLQDTYGKGSRGFNPIDFVPVIGTLSKLTGIGQDFRIGAVAPPSLGAISGQAFSAQSTRADGTQLTRYAGYQPGDYIPGRSDAYMSSAGRGLVESPFGTGQQFSALTPQGTPYFSGFGAFKNAVMDGPGLSVPTFGATEKFAAANRGVFGQSRTESFSNQAGSAFGGGSAAQGGFSGNPNAGFAAGGPVKLASGGMMRDRVPALLEPGEFVIRRPAAKAIGGAALGAMNATGKAPSISVNVNNQGAPKTVAVAPPKMNGDKVILDIITRDLRNNGSIKKSLRRGK